MNDSIRQSDMSVELNVDIHEAEIVSILVVLSALNIRLNLGLLFACCVIGYKIYEGLMLL